MRRINELVCRWAGWRVGHAWRAADGAAALTPCPRTLVADGDGFGPLRAALAAERPARGAGLAGRVLQTGRVVWVANVESDPTFPAARLASMPGIRGACGVPTKRGEQVVGVLELPRARGARAGGRDGPPARERGPGAGVRARAARPGAWRPGGCAGASAPSCGGSWRGAAVATTRPATRLRRRCPGAPGRSGARPRCVTGPPLSLRVGASPGRAGAEAAGPVAAVLPGDIV